MLIKSTQIGVQLSDSSITTFLLYSLSNTSTSMIFLYLSFSALTPASLMCTSLEANVRLFHPSFPLRFKSVLTNHEVTTILNIKSRLGNSGPHLSESKLRRLPWKTLPEIGISATLDKDVFSPKEIDDHFELDQHNGFLLWAHKIKNAKQGCFLLNHFSQQVIHLTDYSLEKGGLGKEIILGMNVSSSSSVIWPPFTLELEITKKLWQPVEVCESISSGEIFKYFPNQMSTAPWEIIFLLLLPANIGDEDEIYQTLFDTGLSPKQGFIAYLRLLNLMVQRTTVFADVPSYRKVFETDVNF